MTQWIGWLRRLDERPCSLVSVIAAEGAAPCAPGTRILVRADGREGSLGSGDLERQAVTMARALLAQPPGAWCIHDQALDPMEGGSCPGRVRLLIERVDPSALDWLHDAEPGRMLATRLEEAGVVREVFVRETPTRASMRGDRPGVGTRTVEPIGERPRPLYLFGAGHVGQAIARHAVGLPLQLAWFDTRPEQGKIDGVTVVSEEDVAACLTLAPADAAIAIVTHDNALDFHLVLTALNRAPVAFVGLLGSSAKLARIRSGLQAEGVSEAALARLTAPIGLPGIRGREPDVIAIAVLAQLLSMRGESGP